MACIDNYIRREMEGTVHYLENGDNKKNMMVEWDGDDYFFLWTTRPLRPVLLLSYDVPLVGRGNLPPRLPRLHLRC